MEKRYTCEEIAEIYSVKVAAIYDWIKKGRLIAIQMHDGKKDKYRIREEDLLKFEQSRLTA